MEHILVGVDGSPASIGALTIAAGLLGTARDAGRSGADLTVAWALDPATIEGTGAAEGAGAAEAGVVAGPSAEPFAQQLATWCDEAGLELPYEPLLVVGAPGRALVDAVAGRAVDLVVMGTEGTIGRSGPRFGSVANLLAHRLDVPFLMVPVGCRWRGTHEVVIGVDGSEGTAAAVRFLAELPGIDQATVTAVFDCQPLTGWTSGPVPEVVRQRAEHDIGTWTAPLAESGCNLRLVVKEDGHPSIGLLATAGEVHADLVVAGAQATSRLTGQRAGSTVFQLLHQATRPTMLVPPERPAAPAP